MQEPGAVSLAETIKMISSDIQSPIPKGLQHKAQG